MKNITWPRRIVEVRHGDSVRNHIRRRQSAGEPVPEFREYFESVPDHLVDLTAKGDKQTLSAGHIIAPRFPHFDVAFHSGYLRTKKTLRNVLAAYPEEERKRIPVREDILLREREQGRAFMMDLERELAEFPWWDKHFKLFGRMFARPETGESVAMVADRANTFLMKLRLDYAGKDVLIATHGRMLVTMRMILEDWSIEQTEAFMTNHNPERPKNAGITVYEYDEELGKMKLIEYNTHCGYHERE